VITSIIVHYKRPQNIPAIVNAIHGQTIKSEIWIWDNSGDCPDVGDVMIRANYNFAQLGRWMLLQAVQTPYVWLNDDDGKINDSTLFDKLIKESDEYSPCMLGWKGKVFKDAHPEKPYQNIKGWVQSGQKADMINMGFSFFPRNIINSITRNPFDELTEQEFQHGDEIHISNKIDVRSSKYILDAIDLMDEQGVKLSGKSEHMEIRNKLCKEYWL